MAALRCDVRAAVPVPNDMSQAKSSSKDTSLHAIRIDKWLWAARFYKTRTLATHSVDLGRVTLNGDRIKPARNIVVGDVLKIRTEHGDFEIEVRQLSESRGPAPVAALLYQETEASIQAREREQLARQMGGQDGYQGKGRPTKRDRRRIGGVGFGD